MKLLVSDFDGTYFLNDDDIKVNNKMIKKWQSQGNLFMLSSGRSFNSLKDVTKKYNIPYDYLSCGDGSILYDKNDNLVVKHDLNSDIIKEFLELETKVTIKKVQYSYQDDYYDTYKDDKLIGLNLVIKNQNITKSFLKDYEDIANKYQNYDFLHYRHDDVTFFCLKNKGINKSSTVKYLERSLKIPFEDIYTVGDNENDFEMLRQFNSYYIGEVASNIKKVTIKGYNSVSNLINDLLKSDD